MNFPQTLEHWIAYGIVAAILLLLGYFVPSLKDKIKAMIARMFGVPEPVKPVEPDNGGSQPMQPTPMPPWIPLLLDEVMRRLPKLVAEEIDQRAYMMHKDSAGEGPKSYRELIALRDALNARAEEIKALEDGPVHELPVG